jgi:hypothetical protein
VPSPELLLENVEIERTRTNRKRQDLVEKFMKTLKAQKGCYCCKCFPALSAIASGEVDLNNHVGSLYPNLDIPDATRYFSMAEQILDTDIAEGIQHDKGKALLHQSLEIKHEILEGNMEDIIENAAAALIQNLYRIHKAHLEVAHISPFHLLSYL